MTAPNFGRMPPGVVPPVSRWIVMDAPDLRPGLLVNVQRQQWEAVADAFNPGGLWREWWSWRITVVLGWYAVRIYRMRVKVVS